MVDVRSGLRAMLLVAALAGTASWSIAHAQAPASPGRDGVATAAPPVPRPSTQPCVVVLFPYQAFGEHGDGARMDAAPHRFTYRPPAACPGPWAKVVLEADFAVDAGEQYDRTASIWLDGVNVYFGTTQEPAPGVAPHWQVQRDLTGYASVLRQAGSGEVAINNWLDEVRASVIHAGARLLFYPVDATHPPPRVPDRVFALNGAGSMPARLDGPQAQLARALVFPRNTARVYLDLIAEPQAHDEFYYMCLPDRVVAAVGAPRSNGSIDRADTCTGGSFREVEVRIDGMPAGLAPVVPRIFTGGLDPFLWQPIPAAETLDFIPYRIDLTPFAGVLADGKPHRIAVAMRGNAHFFAIAAAVLVYRDAHASRTGGAVVRNTLQGTLGTPTITSTLAADRDGVHGDVVTRARTHYLIEGYIDTPAGRVRSRVEATLDFGNVQQFIAGDRRGPRHLVAQTARVDSTSETSGARTPAHSLRRIDRYAVHVHTRLRPDEGTQRARSTEVRQTFVRELVQRTRGLPTYRARTIDAHVAADDLAYTQGDRTSFRSQGQSSAQVLRFTNSLGDCYQSRVQAHARKPSGAEHGTGCLGGGSMHWFARPDGSPDGFGWRGAPGHAPPAPPGG